MKKYYMINKRKIMLYYIDCKEVNNKVSEIMSEEYLNVFKDAIINSDDGNIISIFDKIKQVFNVINPGEDNINLLLNFIYSYIN